MKDFLILVVLLRMKVSSHVNVLNLSLKCSIAGKKSYKTCQQTWQTDRSDEKKDPALGLLKTRSLFQCLKWSILKIMTTSANSRPPAALRQELPAQWLLSQPVVTPADVAAHQRQRQQVEPTRQPQSSTFSSGYSKTTLQPT